MSEGLQTLDGSPVAVPDKEQIKRQFAQAMASGPVSDIAPPPRKQPAVKTDKPKPRTRTSKPRVKAAPPAPSPELDKRRAEGVAESLNLMAAGALMVRASVKDKDPKLGTALAADAYVLSSQAEAFGQTCAALARHSPGFARLIDGSGKAGPWFAFSTAVYSIGGQLAANHGVIPAGLLGTAKPEELAALIEAPDSAVTDDRAA